jgi:translocation and assembly module TamB
MDGAPPPALEDGEDDAPPPQRRRVRWASGLAKWAVGVLLGLILLAAAAAFLLDTAPGHRFLADRIAGIAPESGLRIQIGRIDGSIWGDTRLVDVRLYDAEGLFAEAPLIEVDWQPLGWITNHLVIHDLEARLAALHRLPKLRAAEEPGPILPGFDLHIGRLDIAQLRIGKPVTGTPRVASLSGEADIRAGRALVRLEAALKGGGDRVLLRLDAQPDRDRFDLDARIQAPANSVVGALLGTRRPISLTLDGDGRWASWAGAARLDLSGRRTAELQLKAQAGRYAVSGWLSPAQFLSGKQQRLTAPRILLNGRGTFAERRLEGRLSMRSSALRVEAAGLVDLGRSRVRNLRLAADLLQPPALFPNMLGQRVRLTAVLNGGFRSFEFAYRMTGARMQFNNTGLERFAPRGGGGCRRRRSHADRLHRPAGHRRRRHCRQHPRQPAGRRTAARHAARTARGGAHPPLGQAQRQARPARLSHRRPLPGEHRCRAEELPDTRARAGRCRNRPQGRPPPQRQGHLATGKGRAWLRRFDNKFLLGLAGGLPYAEADLVRGNDFISTSATCASGAPSIAIQGPGFRRRDGTFSFEGQGRQATYGAFGIALDGRIERPRITLRLPRPNEALGIRDMILALEPNPSGFAYRASGGSHLGPSPRTATSCSRPAAPRPSRSPCSTCPIPAPAARFVPIPAASTAR